MKVLLPTDYSDNALRAFEYVQELFTSPEDEFVLINIQNARHAGAIMSIDLNQDIVNYSYAKMDELLSSIRVKNPDTKVTGLVTAGTFMDSITEKIEELAPDFVAIGSKGAGRIKTALLGSNTSTLITHCDTPLIVVPNDVEIKYPNRALLASDFVKDPNPETYDPLLDLCYAKKAHLNILHVTKPNETHFTAKDVPFNTEGLDYTLNERVDSDVEYAIIDFIEQNDIDIIGVVKSKGGFIHDLFHPSLTKKLGMHTDTPLMVLV